MYIDTFFSLTSAYTIFVKTLTCLLINRLSSSRGLLSCSRDPWVALYGPWYGHIQVDESFQSYTALDHPAK